MVQMVHYLEYMLSSLNIQVSYNFRVVTSSCLCSQCKSDQRLLTLILSVPTVGRRGFV